MKDYLIILLIGTFFIRVNCFGQGDQVDYGFINMSLSQIDTNKILLRDNVYVPSLSSDYILYYQKELSGKIPMQNLRQLVKNAERLRATNESRLIQDSIVGIRLLNDSQYSVVVKHNLERKNLSPIFYSSISIPVFDDQRKYAFIVYGKGIAPLNRIGASYLFKKVKSKWILVGSFNSWAS